MKHGISAVVVMPAEGVSPRAGTQGNKARGRCLPGWVPDIRSANSGMTDIRWREFRDDSCYQMFQRMPMRAWCSQWSPKVALLRTPPVVFRATLASSRY